MSRDVREQSQINARHDRERNTFARHRPHTSHGATVRYHQHSFLPLLGMNSLTFYVATEHIPQNHSTPLLLVRDCYECIVLTSFFYLLLLYLSPRTAEQQEIFRKVCILYRKVHAPLSAADDTPIT